ncbi:MAG: sigma-70 family RNA polymerase sigma factor [Pirellulales bacterium]
MKLPAPSLDCFSLSTQRIEHSLKDARNGNLDSLGELFDAAKGYLSLVAQQSLNDELGQKLGGSDLVQETFLAAQNNFGQFRGTTGAELLTWLRAILANNVMLHYRHYCCTQKRDITREQSFENACISPADLASPKTDTPSQIISRQEDRSQVEAAIGKLTPNSQLVLRMRHQQGLNFHEIAHRMDRTEGAVRQLWYRAFDQLIKKLDGAS